MKVAYEAAFLRDIKRIRDRKVRRQAQRAIDRIKQTSSL